LGFGLCQVIYHPFTSQLPPIWVCLKIEYIPQNLIVDHHFPYRNVYFKGIPHFQTGPFTKRIASFNGPLRYGLRFGQVNQRASHVSPLSLGRCVSVAAPNAADVHGTCIHVQRHIVYIAEPTAIRIDVYVYT